MSSLYEQLSPASMTVREALNLSEALRDIPLKSHAERATRALAGAYLKEQTLRRAKSEPRTGEMTVRILCDRPGELLFQVGYADIVCAVSVGGSDHPNPGVAGHTSIHWYRPLPAQSDLAETAKALRQIAEIIDDIDILGARKWLELYQIATRSLE